MKYGSLSIKEESAFMNHSAATSAFEQKDRLINSSLNESIAVDLNRSIAHTCEQQGNQ